VIPGLGMIVPKIGMTGWLLVFCGLTVAFGGLQTHRLKAEKREHAEFRAQVKAVGEAQEKRTQETIARNQKAKESADAQVKRLTAANKSLADSLLNARSSSGYLPRPAPGSASPDRACFDRAELESAIAQLDAGLSGIAGKGDEARIAIDGLRDWAKAQVK
jgi:hypothetical protein